MALFPLQVSQPLSIELSENPPDLAVKGVVMHLLVAVNAWGAAKLKLL